MPQLLENSGVVSSCAHNDKATLDGINLLKPVELGKMEGDAVENLAFPHSCSPRTAPARSVHVHKTQQCTEQNCSPALLISTSVLNIYWYRARELERIRCKCSKQYPLAIPPTPLILLRNGAKTTIWRQRPRPRPPSRDGHRVFTYGITFPTLYFVSSKNGTLYFY